MLDIAQEYGLDFTGATDCGAGLTKMAGDIDVLFKMGKPLPSLVFRAGTYKFSQWPNLAYPRLKLWADGEVRLLGNVVFDGRITYPGAAEPGPNAVHFAGFEIYPSTGVGLTVVACHRSRFDARVVLPGPACPTAMEVQFCVLSEFRVALNGSDLKSNGLIVDALPGNPSLQTTACMLTQPIIEGCDTGLWLKNAGVTTAIGGSIESCNTAIKIESTCGNTRVFGTDLEGNKDWDIYDQGHSNDFDVAPGLKWWHSLPFGL